MSFVGAVGAAHGGNFSGSKRLFVRDGTGNKHFKEKYLAWNSQERVKTEENLK